MTSDRSNRDRNTRAHRRSRLAYLLAGLLLAISISLQSGALASTVLPIGRLFQAQPFDPGCASGQVLCRAWEAFRRRHPYPLQTIAAEPIGDGQAIILIAEPSPNLGRARWQRLVENSFGTDLLGRRRYRWMIGADGWVEDLLLLVKTNADASDSVEGLLADPIFRDRMALLHLAMYGSTFGARLASLDALSTALVSPINTDLKPNAAELYRWITDSDLAWTLLEAGGLADDSAAHWRDLVEPAMPATLISTDGTLVMLAFPAAELESVRSGEHPSQALRSAFRGFAVAGDIILGGAWDDHGEVILIARARQVSRDLLPPPRFETFLLLAKADTDELHQSYARNHLLAGKLSNGKYAFCDWAPVELSRPLIDTEFGALLNITDQMLKAWSQAGEVDYVYFDYPATPTAYPFDQQPLSEVIQAETGSRQTLFNWNTEGFAASIAMPGWTLVAPWRTAVLPITYGGALIRGGVIRTGHLLPYEDRAAEYFAGLGDPNLLRAAQYSLLFQIVQGIIRDRASRQGALAALFTRVHQAPRDPLPANRLLVNETDRLLQSITRMAEEDADLMDANRRISDFLEKYGEQQHGTLTRQALAQLLSEPTEEQIQALLDAQTEDAINGIDMAELEQLLTHDAALSQLDKDRAALEAKAAALVEGGDLGRLGLIGLRAEFASLERRTIELICRGAELSELTSSKLLQGANTAEQTARLGLLADLAGLRCSLSAVVNKVIDRDGLRTSFMAAREEQQDGSIQTPSIVLSWAANPRYSVGGHNIGARTLKAEPSRDIASIALVETSSGELALRYNPAYAERVAARINDINRAIFRGEIRSQADLRAMLKPMGRSQPRSKALGLVGDAAAAARARQTTWQQPFVDSVSKLSSQELVAGLREIAARHGNSLYVVRDRSGIAYLAERRRLPLTGVRVTPLADTPTLTAALARRLSASPDKTLVMYGMPRGHVEAINRGITLRNTGPGELMKTARLIGHASPKSEGQIQFISTAGKDARPARLTARVKSADPVKSLGSITDGYFARPIWSQARIRSVTGVEAKSMLPGDWQNRLHGVPSVVTVSFPKASPGTVSGITLVGGVKGSESGQAASHIAKAARELIGRSTSGETTIGNFFERLKARLQALPGPRFERLEMMIQQRQNQIFFSQRKRKFGVSSNG
jgi:hypothetical protein